MTRYLHTMYRITDPEKSRRFYEALGFEFRRELPIVRHGELEAAKLRLERLREQGIEPESEPYPVSRGRLSTLFRLRSRLVSGRADRAAPQANGLS